MGWGLSSGDSAWDMRLAIRLSISRDREQGQLRLPGLSYLCAQIYERHPGSKQQLTLGGQQERRCCSMRRRMLGQKDGAGSWGSWQRAMLWQDGSGDGNSLCR